MKKVFALICSLSFIAIGCDSKQKTNEQQVQATETSTDSLTVSNETFSAVTLNKMFEDTSGNKISFQNILAKHKGSPIVIDVWASWCPDCIKGFPELKNLQQNYPKTAYVFLSLDKTKDKWTQAIAKYDLQGDHYYLNEKMKDEFGQSIQLDWIPRYIVVDPQGNIALKKAIVANDAVLVNTLNKIQP